MPRNEDGEFELLLGNRQLLSVFFIVVILLGVFFTMGYIVGRNSGGALVADAGKGATSLVVEPSEKPSAVGSSEQQAPAQTAEATQPASAPAQQTAAAQPEQSAAKNEPHAVVAPAAMPPAAPAKPVVQTAPSPAPQTELSGTYLQVSAVGKATADVMVDVLHSKGFQAMAVSVPENPSIYRVLVGPLKDAADMALTRSKLETAGLAKSPIVRKY